MRSRRAASGSSSEPGVVAVVDVEGDEPLRREVAALAGHALPGDVDGRVDVAVRQHHRGEGALARGDVEHPGHPQVPTAVRRVVRRVGRRLLANGAEAEVAAVGLALEVGGQGDGVGLRLRLRLRLGGLRLGRRGRRRRAGLAGCRGGGTRRDGVRVALDDSSPPEHAVSSSIAATGIANRRTSYEMVAMTTTTYDVRPEFSQPSSVDDEDVQGAGAVDALDAARARCRWWRWGR